MASCKTSWSQAFRKSCRGAAGQYRPYSQRRCRHALRAIRILCGEQGQTSGMLRRRVSGRGLTSRVAHREDERLRGVFGLRPKILPRVDVVHHFELAEAYPSQWHTRRRAHTGKPSLTNRVTRRTGCEAGQAAGIGMRSVAGSFHAGQPSLDSRPASLTRG